MIDYNLLKHILDSSDGVIENQDKIPWEVLQLLSEYNKSKISLLFKKCSSYKNVRYKCEIKCPICNQTKWEMLTKKETLSLIISIKLGLHRNIRCFECRQREKLEQSRIYQQQLFKQRTLSYINNYLNSNYSWNIGISTKQKYDELSANVDREKVANVIRQMDYHTFLKTPYWKGIAEIVRRNSGYKCQLCGKRTTTHIHHPTYDIHGHEFEHIHDLICLCEDCHKKFHDK